MKRIDFFNKLFNHKLLSFITALLLLLFTFSIYKNIYQEPRNWYDHYMFLARSLSEGRVDIPDLPQFYHDKIEFEGKTYLPFPPMAAAVIVPFLSLFPPITQQSISIIFGALNVMLIYLLLKRFTSNQNSLLLALLFGFGTTFFWSALVGTTWFFAHVVGIFFLIISLILHFQKRDFLSGLFLALSGLTRLPLILSGLFYLLELFKERKRLFLTVLGAFIFIPVLITYNYLRFGTLGEYGYLEVYRQYTGGSYAYTIMQLINPGVGYNGYMDVKNIPLHLFTIFLMPPTVEIIDGVVKTLQPSPFGMGIVFTSPLLLLAFWPNFKNRLQRNLFLTAVFASLPTMLHYMQGWVQFGYRFLLDYLVFLMIILALKFKPTKINIILLIISITVNVWGVLWAIRLGW